MVDMQMRDSFSFAKKWDYPWDVFKDDSTGEFSKANGDPLLPVDTAHLFYTANCSTNIQGGYDLRYCFATKSRGTITLTFSDGLPAYANEFYIYVSRDSFEFRPNIIYPMRNAGEKISYRVVKQNLILNKNNYRIGDTIIGYIQTEFIESVSLPGKKLQDHSFFLKGFIRTKLQGG